MEAIASDERLPPGDRFARLALLCDEILFVDVREELVRYRRRDRFVLLHEEAPRLGQTLSDIFGPIYPSIRTALAQSRAKDAPQWGAYDYLHERLSSLVMRNFVVLPVGALHAVMVWHYGLRAYGSQPNHQEEGSK